MKYFRSSAKFNLPPHICFLFACRSILYFRTSGMEIRTWNDRRSPAVPRVTIQQGNCDRAQCGQFSISISNGERGLTVRFDSEAEFREFLERGAAEQP